MKPKALFINKLDAWASTVFPRVWTDSRRKQLREMVDLHEEILRPSDLSKPEVRDRLRETEIVFSTWGMPLLTSEQLDAMPNLRAVFYAAGTVKSFAPPLLARGITVASAWVANAVPVAEFSAAQIILALKQAQRITRRLHNGGPAAWAEDHAIVGAYGSTVALISLGQIGIRVARLVKNFDVKIIAYEPYAKPEVKELGIELVSLEECFKRADVVSLHAPNLPSTKKMIKREHLASMKPHATFINTARAAIVDQEAMLEVLASRPDINAVIDVTDPTEPPPQGSPYYTLPNLFLTCHIAGSVGNEVQRMADYMIEECGRFLKGEKLRYAVTESMLDTMA